jgi:FKBP-type peptidyl-prolyl cis-trans isomerase
MTKTLPTTGAGATSTTTTQQDHQEEQRPKSKKELRAAKKAAKKAPPPSSSIIKKGDDKEAFKAERQRLVKARRQQQKRDLLKHERQEKKLRQQKRLNRERNAPKDQKTKQPQQQQRGNNADNDTQQQQDQEEKDVAMNVLKEVLHGSSDAATGITTIPPFGVQYKDLVVGKGSVSLKSRHVATVQYKLRGGQFGSLLDSSDDFSFTVGRGEVIQGWDVGVVGMKVGGRRKLIVPPKAGYGSKDIGAGPGAVLKFDITLLAIRKIPN